MMVPVILFSRSFTDLIVAGLHSKFEDFNLRDEHEQTIIGIIPLTGVAGVVVSILVDVSLPSIFVKLYFTYVVILVGSLTLGDGKRENSCSYIRIAGIGMISAFNRGLSVISVTVSIPDCIAVPSLFVSQ
ncbi:MAG: hypothetical protein ACFFER_03120 [Candidatus Thorarchaeota archaeon]